MPSGPKSTEDRIARMLNAWQELAPDKSFGGMTPAQFEAATAPSLAARQRIDDLEDQRKQAMADRDRADDESNTKMQLVVAGVLGDPTEAPTARSTKPSAIHPSASARAVSLASARNQASNTTTTGAFTYDKALPGNLR